MNYAAHFRVRDGAHQSVEEHLRGVQRLAEMMGEKIGVRHITGLAGMLHDMGKFSEAFRLYLQNAFEHPDTPPRRGSVDHSTAGGKLLYKLYHEQHIYRFTGILAEIVGNAIISHHSDLHDFLTPNLESDYLKRVKEKSLEEYELSESLFFERVMTREAFTSYVDCAAKELEDYLAVTSTLTVEARLMFLTKYVFSVLIDADRTDTRRFEEDEAESATIQYSTLFKGYYERLQHRLSSFSMLDGTIHNLRREMSEHCDRAAEQASSIYTLSIPTGGGKTLASLRYALKHAFTHSKRRIIYVLPYTTIIEQNAAEVRRILEDDANVLEHHSNVIEQDLADDEDVEGRIDIKQKWKLAKDNWDVPVIFTTMVQFLNVFYDSGSRSIRRLHQLSESVIVFDEVQKVPVTCVSLFNQALHFLRDYGRSSLVLCTATQPALDFVEHKLSIGAHAEIIPDLNRIAVAFKRVEVIDRTSEAMTNDRLYAFVEEMMIHCNSTLVILNTKSVVKKLFLLLQSLRPSVYVYHLSTSMCPAHRTEILSEIKERLRSKDKVICISTPLIEAGVDISFERVIRSLSGLDSVAQAAGRCNRHGENDKGEVYIIHHLEEKLDNLPEIRKGREISQRMLIDMKEDPAYHGGSILSAAAMTRYFREFYKEMSGQLDYPVPQHNTTMMTLLAAPRTQNLFAEGYYSKHKCYPSLFLLNSCRTAGQHFDVIDNQTTSVIVPYDQKGKELVADLNGDRNINELSLMLRLAQRYSIQVYDQELRQLNQYGGLVSCLDGKVLVLKESAYHENFGLDVSNDSGFEIQLY
ncbi:CRISPR-associated helicase Cas3' [Paenibacillus sp. F411]|uniref:CRISPR-associated helicase Cas3' n=1 Tax=Paenibacillus sp. F411 TaxID=2820239 RepID=UPI001AAE8BF2|nr:CRISPR-associated helicase Cas3' [Paenibacillus sp. F411]MBO2946153.1 CRISPR-associated helicase Cas3' [Paenibacillus sp. F411]